MGEAELRVRGGAGGIAAHLDDLDRAGRLLRGVAVDLAAQARRVVRAMLDPGLQLTAPAAPVTYARAGAEAGRATAGPHGLIPLAAGAAALGTGVGLAVDAYRAADRAAGEAVQQVGTALGRLLGAGAARVFGPGLVAGAAVGATVGLIVAAVRPGSAELPGGLPRALQRAGRPVLRLLSEHASAVESGVPVASAAVGGAVGELPAGRLSAQVLTGRYGGPVTVREFALGLGALGVLAGPLAGDGPWLHDSGAVRVEAHAVPWRGAPAGVAGVLARVPEARPGTAAGTRAAAADRPVIHVERIDGTDGRRRWVVGVPGTADWSPAAGPTPFDLTGDVRLMAGQRTAGMAAVTEAMRTAGVRPGEPVLLAGHSQGGLIVASLAADRSLAAEFTVSHVVTTGAPIAGIDIPGRVQVLAVEHTDDLVPRLDGEVNRDRPNWVTASAHSPAHRPGEPGPRPLHAHALTEYERTAARIDTATDPSLAYWRAGAAPFVADPRSTGAAWDFSVTRMAP